MTIAYKIPDGISPPFLPAHILILYENLEVKNNKVQNVIEINKKKNNSQVYKNTL